MKDPVLGKTAESDECIWCPDLVSVCVSVGLHTWTHTHTLCGLLMMLSKIIVFYKSPNARHVKLQGALLTYPKTSGTIRLLPLLLFPPEFYGKTLLLKTLCILDRKQKKQAMPDMKECSLPDAHGA